MTTELDSPEKDIRDQESNRQYTVSISEEDRRKSFEIEDERWQLKYQLRDWLILGVLVLITLVWTLFVYFLQPGLR